MVLKLDDVWGNWSPPEAKAKTTPQPNDVKRRKPQRDGGGTVEPKGDPPDVRPGRPVAGPPEPRSGAALPEVDQQLLAEVGGQAGVEAAGRDQPADRPQGFRL